MSWNLGKFWASLEINLGNDISGDVCAKQFYPILDLHLETHVVGAVS